MDAPEPRRASTVAVTSGLPPGATSPDTGAPTPVPTHRYRPELDGIRAIAVYLVILFHAGLGGWTGGFIGVDVFFVLSGYLVTGVLLRGLSSGRSDLRRFYARRARRLLPAALVLVVVTAAVFSAVAPPAELAQAAGGMRWASLYGANWFFVRQATDYFATDVATSPVLHLWSLSVEEQFYLVWPILLLGLWWLARPFGRHRRAAVVTVVAVLAGASVMQARWFAAHGQLERAYYGTDTRTYQLLGGALLALGSGWLTRRSWPWVRRAAPALAVGAVVALVILATSTFAVDPIDRGIATAIITLSLLVAFELAERGPLHTVLSSAPLVELGRISYGTYLWHWLVIVVAVRKLDMAPGTTAVASAVIATGLASLSYRLLEHPIRRAGRLDRWRLPVVAVGLALSLLVALVAVPAIVRGADRPRRESVALEQRGGTPVPAGLMDDIRPVDGEIQTGCKVADIAACTRVIGKASAPTVLLLGDSHADMYLAGFKALARKHQFTLAAATRSQCPWMEGLQASDTRVACRKAQTGWYDSIIPKIDPDIVVLVSRSYDVAGWSTVRDENDRRVVPFSEEHDAEIAARTRASVAELVNEGRKVVILEPIPLASVDFDPQACLSGATYLDECRYVAEEGTGVQERADRAVAAEHPGRVWSIDLDPLVCPYAPICDPMVLGTMVKHDASHLTAAYTEKIAPVLDQELTQQKVW